MPHTRFALALCGILAFVVCGCVPSVHPLYTEKDVVFDPGLVGSWQEEDGDEKWNFQKAGEKEYKLEYVDNDGRVGKFEVHLVKIKGKMFLDFYPEEPEPELNEFYKCHLFPVHMFARVSQIQPTLKMAFLDPDWLTKRLERRPRPLRYEETEDGLLLTAQPKKLQSFLLKHFDDEDAWGDESDLKRMQKEPRKKDAK